MYDVFDHICPHVKLVYCVTILIVFNEIYSFNLFYILCYDALGIDESEISVCMHACMYVCMNIHQYIML